LEKKLKVWEEGEGGRDGEGGGRWERHREKLEEGGGGRREKW
jgi:hypothetical protein